jgi:hypothetical protein
VDYSDTLAAEPSRAKRHWHLPARGARWLAWSLWIAAVAQVALGLLLAGLNQLTWRRLFAEYLVVSSASTLAFATVGLLIVARRAGNTIGWLLCAMGPVWGLNVWAGQYARYALVARPGALVGGAGWAWRRCASAPQRSAACAASNRRRTAARGCGPGCPSKR